MYVIGAKPRTILSVLGAVLLLFCAVGPATAAEPGVGVYEFPTLPGSEQWNKLNSRQEMDEATQVPANLLASMSTGDLIETVLRYPMLAEIFAFDKPQAGVEAVISRFNGLQELLARPDAAKELLARYQAQDPAAIPSSWSLLEQGQFAYQTSYLELIMAQEPILSNLGFVGVQELLHETLVKKEQKLERFDVYGSLGLENTALLAGRGLEQVDPTGWTKEGGDGFELDSFLRNADFASPVLMDGIFNRAAEMIDGAFEPVADAVDLKSLQPRANKDYYSTVYTPNGTAVSVIVMTYELTAAQISATNTAADNFHFTAIRETNASRRYNCHSYAFYSQSTSNVRWMNTPGDDKYWQDGSYIQVSSLANGIRISYVYGDHSAIGISSSQARSKWGQWPRMRHSPTITPYNSSLLRYYQRNLCSSNPPDLVPTLTGNTSAVSTSGVYSSSYPAWKAFDSSNSMWISQVWETPAWIGYNFGSNKRVTKYTIKNTNGSSLTSRAPKHFQLRGWNGSSWITVDNRTNQTGWVSGTPRTYTVSSPGYYSQYRLHITDDNDSRSGVVVISIGDLQFRGCN